MCDTMTMDPMGISISLYKPMDKQKDIYLTHVFREKSIKLSPPLIFNVPQIAATKKTTTSGPYVIKSSSNLHFFS